MAVERTIMRELPKLTLDRRDLPASVKVKAKTGKGVFSTKEYEVWITEKDDKIRVYMRSIGYDGRVTESTEHIEISV